MKTRMMIGIAVAALLLAAGNVKAQSGVERRTRTERPRDERYIDRADPRRESRYGAVERRGPVLKVVDNIVIRSFERERFDSDRLKMADMIFSTGGLMTVAQITRVSTVFDYDSNRIKFLKKAYRNCVDPYNYYQVLVTLEYGSSRDKIMDYVLDDNYYSRNEAPVRKISSSDMSGIIKTLKNEPFDSRRGKLALMIVRTNVFTSRQIADMAKTYDFDSNRYKFLLNAYDRCIDPQNYLVAANTLEFSSNRNDLIRKISRR